MILMRPLCASDRNGLGKKRRGYKELSSRSINWKHQAIGIQGFLRLPRVMIIVLVTEAIGGFCYPKKDGVKEAEKTLFIDLRSLK